jgi:hypothetical protein
MYNHAMKQVCAIQQVDQSGGSNTTVIAELPCSFPYPYIYRQASAETAYDFQPLQVFTHVPKDQIIEENMRLVFETGNDFRIHSVNKWPLVRPEYLEIILQGSGHGS